MAVVVIAAWVSWRNWSAHSEAKFSFDSALLNGRTNNVILQLSHVPESPNDQSLLLSQILENVGWVVLCAIVLGGGFVLTSAIGRAIRHLRRRLMARCAASPSIGGDEGAFVFVALFALQRVGEVVGVLGIFFWIAVMYILAVRFLGPQ